MADYLYHTYIFHNTTNVIGVDPATEAANVTDFETNYKTPAVKIDDISIQSTTFESIKTYTQFKALVDGVILTWGDVKYAKEDKAYDIYLLTDSPL
jgi:hypothetical protein